MHRLFPVVLLASLATCCVTLLRAADAIPNIGPVGEVVKVHGEFEFTEGPTDDAQGNIYFSDIPKNRIYKVDTEGKLSTFLEPSNHTNGLMFNAAGQLFACEMDGRIVRIDPKTKEVKAVAPEYNGKRFNAPNDLVLDKAGGVYFTDPRFRAPTPLPQEKEAVYYADAAGKVTRLYESDKAPNGVILSPDEKKLYVIPSMTKQMMVFDVLGPGKLGEGKVFCELAQEKPDGNGGGDGLTIDSKGNLYITSGLGLQVFSPEGKHLGTIKFPEQPANATFGGKDLDTLYVTARKGLYSVKMEAKGHRFTGKVGWAVPTFRHYERGPDDKMEVEDQGMNPTEHHAALLEGEGASSALLPLRHMTEEEFVAACDEKTRAEWVDGEVILMSPVNVDHISLNYWLARVIGLFVEDRDLGVVLGQEFFIRFPAQRRRRLPDLFFVAEAHRSQLRRTFYEGAPDLMLELVSPDSVERDYDDKRKEYEAAGVREYWIIDPEKREWLPLALNERGRYQPIAEKEGVVRSRVLDGFWLRTEWLWEPRPKVRWVLEQIERSAQGRVAFGD